MSKSITLPSPPYKCNLCNRGYKIKANYTKHIVFCEFLSKSTYEKEREKENDYDKVPSIQTIYQVLLEVVKKNAELEKKVEALTKWTESKKRKLNIIEWLNNANNTNNEKMLPFKKWWTSIIITRAHLEIMFNQSDGIHGTSNILKNVLALTPRDELPLRAFNQKDNTLFVYNENNNTENNNSKSWEILSDALFTECMHNLTKKILAEFLKWQNENGDKKYEEEFSYISATNLQKILGNNYSQEQIKGRIKKELYKEIKMNLANITEYEFSF